MGETEQVEAKMIATQDDLDKNQIPMQWRDFCAHKLIPLNKCRRKNFYMPFRCEDERHDYEKCQHDQYMRRVGEMKAIVKQKRKAEREAKDAAEREELKAAQAAHAAKQ